MVGCWVDGRLESERECEKPEPEPAASAASGPRQERCTQLHFGCLAAAAPTNDSNSVLRGVIFLHQNPPTPAASAYRSK